MRRALEQNTCRIQIAKDYCSDDKTTAADGGKNYSNTAISWQSNGKDINNGVIKSFRYVGWQSAAAFPFDWRWPTDDDWRLENWKNGNVEKWKSGRLATDH